MATIKLDSEAEWLAVREEHIGGSEITSLFYQWRTPEGDDIVLHMYEQPPQDAILLGCLGSFATGYRLWQEKSGILPPENLDFNERVNAGKYLEPAIAEWAKSKWDWNIRKVRRYLTHETVKGWGASLDYEVFGGDDHFAPVEFKNVDYVVFQRDWVVDDDEIIAPPLKYLLQLQHQMGATNAESGWIVACVSGNKLLRGKLPIHQPTQERIAAAVAAFWHGVHNRIEPKHVADMDTVKKLYANGEKNAGIDLTTDNELPFLVRRHLRVQKHMKVMETHWDNCKARIAAKMGEKSKALGDGFNLSWPVVHREEKIIPERKQAALTYRGALTVTKGK